MLDHLPQILIISDSLGDTATTVAQAAASQFDEDQVSVSRLYKASSMSQIRPFLEEKIAALKPGEDMVLLYTIVNPELRDELEAFMVGKPIRPVDLISGAIAAIAESTGLEPTHRPGANREVDAAYLKRIEAMDFAVDHDDGRNPEGLKDADIVLIGVSRSSKTPLSMYLGSLGYKVANVPLVPGSTPPEQLYDLDPMRVFGLISTPEVLERARRRRIGEEGARLAPSYVNLDCIEDDLEDARRVMKKVGCRVIHTEHRAIEETAQEILRYRGM